MANGHPDELLSDRELHNFSVFLRANPHLTRSSPEGAFDASPFRYRYVPGKRIRTHVKDFSDGGKFDIARYASDEEGVSAGGDILEMLRTLASKLSPEGWAILREVCLEDQAGDDEEEDLDGTEQAKGTAKDRRAKDSPPSFPGMPKVGGEKAEDRALSGFASRFADTSRFAVAIPVFSTPKKQLPAMDSQKADSFAARFPGAAAIRVGGR